MSVFSRSKEEIEMEEKFGKLTGDFISFDFDTYIKQIEAVENSKDLPEFMKSLIVGMKNLAIKFKKAKDDCEDDIKNLAKDSFKMMSENMDEIIKITKGQKN